MTKRSSAHFDLIESRGGGKSAGKWREGSFRVVMAKVSCVAINVACVKGNECASLGCKFRWYHAYCVLILREKYWAFFILVYFI